MQDINAASTADGQWPTAPEAPRRPRPPQTGPDRLRAVAAHLHNVGQNPSAIELEYFADELERGGVPTPEVAPQAPPPPRPLPPDELRRLLSSVDRGTLAALVGDMPVRITIDFNPR